MNSFSTPDVVVSSKTCKFNRLRPRAAATGRRFVSMLLLFLFLALGAQAASAATLYWDPDGIATNNNISTGIGLGGTGAWNITSLFWFDPSTNTDVAWPNSGSDIAVFTGTAGTVTVSAGIQANGVTFSKIAVAATTSGTASANSNTLTVGSKTGIVVGQFVTGTGIQPFTIVNAISAAANTITLSSNTTAATSGNVNFFTPYTIAGATLTFTGTTPNAIPTLQSDGATDFGLITAPLAGTVGLLKTGPGPVSLNAANTFSGGFTLQDGTVSYNNATSFGAAANTINVGDATVPLITGGLAIRPNATLTLANNINFNRDVTFRGTSASSIGGATQVININGNITITNLEGSQAATGGTSLTIGSATGGVIQSGGGNSRLILTGPSAYATVSGGSSSTIAATTGGTAATIQDGSGTLGLTFNSTLGTGLQTTSTQFPVRVLPLLANNTFSGGLTLQGGEVNFANNNNLGDPTKPITFTGGGLQFATGNSIDISTVRTLNFQSGNDIIDTNGNNVTFNTAISGAGGLSKQGLGTLTLPVANSYSGTTTLGSNQRSAGSLLITNSGALGTGTIQLSKQTTLTGVLQLSGGITVTNNINSSSSASTTATAGVGFPNIESVDGTNTLTGNITITSSGGTGINFLSDSGSTLTLSGTLSISAQASVFTTGRANDFVCNGDIVVSGAMKDSSVLVAQTLGFQKDGSGKLILTGANTNTGPITINTGIVQVGSSVAGGGSTGTLGSTATTGTTVSNLVTNNSALIFNRTGALAVNNPITGSGTVTQSGSGTTTLSGVSTYTGGTTITGGVLVNNRSVAGSTGSGAAPAGITGNTTNGNATITNLSSTADLAVGARVAGTNIPANTVITEINGTSITISANATGSGTAIALTFPNTITGLSTSNLAVGQAVTGTNIPAGTFITALPTSGTVILLSANPTATGTTSLTFGAGTAVPEGSNMTLGGGTFNTGGRSLSLGTLNLSDATTSGLDFGSGTSRVSYSSFGTGGGTLNVLNYSGTAVTGGGTDQLIISGITAAQVMQIKFVNPSTQAVVNAQLSTGSNPNEVVPVSALPDAPLNLLNNTSISGTTAPTLTTPEDTTLVFKTANNNALSISDADGDANTIYRVELRPSNGRITFNNTNAQPNFVSGSSASSVVKLFTGTLSQINAVLSDISFKPVANFNGAASLRITTNDGANSDGTLNSGSLSDIDTLAITVTSVNDVPTAANDAYSVVSNTTLTVATAQGLLTNDRDVDTTTLTVFDADTTTSGIQPTSGPVDDSVAATGTLTLAANGSFSFVPTSGFVGRVRFTYQATDGTTPSNAATVTINVTAPAATSTNVSSTVTVTRSGIGYNFSTGRYTQRVTLTNTSSNAISDNVFLVIDNLTNATLFNSSGTVSAANAPQSPYVTVVGGLGASGSADASQTIVLEFTNKTGVITYDTRVFSGSAP